VFTLILKLRVFALAKYLDLTGNSTQAVVFDYHNRYLRPLDGDASHSAPILAR
jgi:hypothetical protein